MRPVAANLQAYKEHPCEHMPFNYLLKRHTYFAVCKYPLFHLTSPISDGLPGPFLRCHTPLLPGQTSTFTSSLLGNATQVHRKHGRHSPPPNNMSHQLSWISSSHPTASQKANPLKPPKLEPVIDLISEMPTMQVPNEPASFLISNLTIPSVLLNEKYA